MENFILDIIAKLNKQLSKNAIKNDLKTLNNTMYVRVLARLSKTLAKKELKKQLRELNDLYVNVGTKVKTGKNTKAQIQKNIKELQKTISDLEIGIKATKINKDIENVRNRTQKKAQSTPISFNVEIGKSKLIADIEYLEKRYYKLFSNVSASNKYENILNHAYNVSDQKQLADTKAELAAFTSELKANGLAAQSAKDKWGKLIDRAKELFSAAAILKTIIGQVKQAVSTFLELDTAMTNLYKVQDDISSRDQFSGLLTKWNKLAQKLAVTTKSLINSAAEWSKMGFNLDMSERLAQITAIFEKTAEITNEKASSTLISAAQAFTEIGDLGEDDYVERVEAIGDRINAVGNRYSITSEGIADGLQNASAALKIAGNDLDETIALITATNKIFQSPEEGSNMLKVASMRLRGQVDALKEMGEDAEGVSTDLTKIQQQIYELTGNKVNIFEDDENLKSTYQMMLEIGEVFDKLGDRQQAELLEVMFGKQRASAGASLLLNYQELETIKNDSMNAANSMAEEYSKYMESAEAHLTIFKEKLTETYSTFISGDLIKYTADVGSALLDLVNSTDLLKHGLIAITTLKVGQGISSFGAVIASTVTQMNTLGSAIQQVKNLPLDDVLRRDALDDLGEATKSLTEKNLKLLLSQKGLEESDRIAVLRKHDLAEADAVAKLKKMGLTDATKKNTAANIANAGSANASKGAFTGLATSIKATWAAMSLLEKASIIFAVVSTAWSIYSTIVESSNRKTEEAQQKAKEAADEANTLSNEIAELTNKYISLSEAVKIDASAKEDLMTTQTELLKKLGLEGESIDDLIAKYGSLSNAIKQVSIDSLKDAQIDLIAGVDAARKELLEAGEDGFWGGNNIINATGDDAVKAFKELEKAGIIDSGSFGTGGGAIVLTGDDTTVDGILENYQKLKDAINALRDANAFTGEELSDNSLYQAIYARYSEMKNKVEAYNSAIANLNENLSQQTMLTALQGSEIPKSEEAFEIFKQELIDTAIASKEFIGNEQEIADAINNYLATVSEFAGFYSDPLEEQLEKENGMKEEITTLSTQLTNSKDSLDKFQSSVKSAADAYTTLLSGNYSSSELLDSIQAINQAVTDMGETIDWEEIGSLDELRDKIEDVSRTYAESILSGTGIDVDSDFGKMLTDIIQQMYEVEAEFTGMNAQFDRLQASYKTLTDAMEYYNETGFINLDTLQSLLTADENLISMLEVENGQLVINQEAYENLVATQLLDFKAKLNDAAAAEIEALALNKAEQATNSNAQASSDAVAKLDAETEAFNRNTSAAIANAMQKAQGAGVSNEEIQGVLDKYTEILNAAINNYGNDFPTFMLGAKSAGSSAGKAAGEAFTDTLDKELSALDKKMEAGYIDFNDYIQARLNLIEDYYRQGKISADQYYSYLNKHYDTQLSYMDKVVSAVTRRIDKEIDGLEKQKDDIEEYYQLQIDSLEKEKTLLEEANKERERQRDLQESLYNLERARQQRTKLVYKEGVGMVYETDPDAIRSAEDEVADAQYQIKISEIEKSISKLEEARDQETSAIDEMIDKLQDYKKSWQDITSAYEEQQEDLIAAQILGADWEADILNGRLETLNNFKDNYIAIQQAMVDATYQAAQAMANTENVTIGDSSSGKQVSLESNTRSLQDAMSTVASIGSSVFQHQKYASGTNNAKKGLNLVGEDGAELYFDNHDHVAIVTKPTLIPMEGGEVVKNEQDTKKLLSSDNLKPVDNIGLADIDGKEAEYTIKVNIETNGEIPDVTKSIVKDDGSIILKDGTVLRPLQPGDRAYELQQKFDAYIAKNGGDISSLMTPISSIQKDMEQMVNSLNTVNNVSNSRMQQVVNQEFNVTLPNVTNSTSAEALMRDLQSIATKKFQKF